CDPSRIGQPNHCVPGKNGDHYAGFGLLPSVAAVPAVLVGKLLSLLVHANPRLLMELCVSLFTALLAPLTCCFTAAWIRRLGFSSFTAVCSGLLLGFASPLWNYGAKGFYSEPYFTLALVLAGFLLTSIELPFALPLAGLALGAACACRI